MANFRLSNNTLTWAMTILGEGGSVLRNYDVVLPIGEARQSAFDALRFAQDVGANIDATVRRELDANEDRIASLLRDMRNSRSKDGIDLLSRALTTLVEYGRYIQTVYATHHADEGSLHIVITVTTPPSEVTIYLVMFAGYFLPGGAMKPHVFYDEDELLAFLVGQIQIELDNAKKAIEQAKQTGSASIPNVMLSKEQRQALGLA